MNNEEKSITELLLEAIYNKDASATARLHDHIKSLESRLAWPGTDDVDALALMDLVSKLGGPPVVHAHQLAAEAGNVIKELARMLRDVSQKGEQVANASMLLLNETGPNGSNADEVIDEARATICKHYSTSPWTIGVIMTSAWAHSKNED